MSSTVQPAQIDKVLIRHFLSLVSLHNNVPKDEYEVSSSFVTEYNAVLHYFAVALNENLPEFEIPRSAMSDGKPHGRPGRCETSIFLAKTAALVNYIDQVYLPKEEGRKIGFRLG